MDNVKIRTVADGAGGEAAVETMDADSRLEIGRKTYRFVRRVMQDPVLREKIKARAAEIRAETEKEIRTEIATSAIPASSQ